MIDPTTTFWMGLGALVLIALGLRALVKDEEREALRRCTVHHEVRITRRRFVENCPRPPRRRSAPPAEKRRRRG